MSKCKISVSFDEKNFFWIVVDNGIFIRSPTKEDLIGAKIKHYNKTNTCDICREEYEKHGKELTDKSILYPRNVLLETDKEGNKTREYVCRRHGYGNYQRYDPNSQHNLLKQIGDRRIGNQDPNSSNAKGDNSLELACILYGWIDLNEKNDNYSGGTPLDCHDPKTGLYHQVQGRYYNSVYQWWYFTGFEDEWKKIFENMVCFCFSEDGKIVERIYIFSKKEIERVKGISIYENPSKGGQQNEQYRRTDKDELKKANEILRCINNRK